MVYVAGALAGAVWLYFWLKGHWFAAVLGMIPGIVLAAIADYLTAWPFVFLIGAWIPLAAHSLFRDISSACPTDPVTMDFAAATDRDATFADPAQSGVPQRAFLPRR
jgi:hypothetical protein